MLKVYSLLLLCGIVATSAGFEGPGTPKCLKGTLFMRCTEFRAKVHSENLMTPKERTALPQCAEIVETFISAFKNKDPCGITPESYRPVIEMTMKSLGRDRVTLWSGVGKYLKDMATATGLYTLETGTFLGFMGDGLTFCGKLGGDGIDYDHCPKWGECRNGGDAVGNFWKSISRAFASKAEGRVRILMLARGTRNAYREDSVLGSAELPVIFTTKRVTSLEPLLAYEPDKERVEDCLSGSMLELYKLVKAHGIHYHCSDSPRVVQLVVCKRFPNYPCVTDSGKGGNGLGNGLEKIDEKDRAKLLELIGEHKNKAELAQLIAEHKAKLDELEEREERNWNDAFD